jgi:peptide/nickel transport system substrate-binding protein
VFLKKTWYLLALSAALVLSASACSNSGTDTTTTKAPVDTDAAAATTDVPAETRVGEAAPETTEAAPEREAGTVIIGTTGSRMSLDGADAFGVHDWELLKNIGQGLLRWEPGSADSLVTGAAVDFGEFSEDGLTYTIELKKGLVFGDGTPLTAQSYASQINNRLLVLEGSGGVGPVLGTPYVESVEAVDDVTIKFNLTASWGFFEQLLTGAPYIPVNPSEFPSDELVPFPKAPTYGNGPWFIESYTPNEQTVLKPNPNYDGDAPALDRIIIRYFGDPQTMALAVESGEIDVAWRILGPEIIGRLRGIEGLTVSKVNAGPTRFFIVNHADGFPTSDPNVVRGIASLIDRDEISDRVFGGAVDPLFSPVPPGFLASSDIFDEVYGSPDPTAAEFLLTEAGYTTDSPLELVVAYPPEHYGRTVADSMQVIKEQLEATGQIQVELMAQEWTTYVETVIKGEDYPLSFLGLFYTYPDPDNYISPLVANGGLGTNVTDSENGAAMDAQLQEMVDLMTQAAAESDSAVREGLYAQLLNIYADRVVTLPLWLEAEYVVYRDGVVGSDAFGAADALNIGGTREFNYVTLQDLMG